MSILDQARRERLTRRAVLRGGAGLAAGGISMALLGCGDDDEAPSGSTGSTSAPSATQAAGTGAQRQGGQVTLYQATDAPTLDPHITSAAQTYETAGLLYSRLLSFDASPGNPPYSNILQGDLASEWEESDDGLTYVFTLRDGMKWQNVDPVNGRAVVAEDVVYGLDRMRTPEPQFTAAYLLSVVNTIEAVDDTHVRMTLHEPFAPFLDNLAHTNAMILPRELIEKYGDAREHAAGSGPFILKSHTAGTEYVMERNPDYFGDGPYVDTLRILMVPDASLQLAAMRTGQVDHYTTSSPKRVEELRGSNPELVYHEMPGASGNRLVINANREPYTDTRVRKAIDFAIDRRAIIDTEFQGRARLMYVFGGNMAPFDVPQEEIDAHWKQDLAEAKKLMDSAGFADGFDTEWELNTEGDAQTRMELIQGFIREIGINMTIKPVTYAEHRKNADTQNFIGFTTGVRASTDPDATLFRNYHPLSSQRWISVEDYPTVLELIDKTRTTLDREERIQAVQEASRALIEESLVPGLFDPFPYQVVQPRVHDFSPSGIPGRLEWKHVWVDA